MQTMQCCMSCLSSPFSLDHETFVQSHVMTALDDRQYFIISCCSISLLMLHFTLSTLHIHCQGYSTWGIHTYTLCSNTFKYYAPYNWNEQQLSSSWIWLIFMTLVIYLYIYIYIYIYLICWQWKCHGLRSLLSSWSQWCDLLNKAASEPCLWNKEN